MSDGDGHWIDEQTSELESQICALQREIADLEAELEKYYQTEGEEPGCAPIKSP
jgi:hypothetical protein